MKVKKYQTYIFKVFLKNFLLISAVFLGLSFILNLFEEIKFFDEHNVKMRFVIFLNFLNTPSIFFELFPFVFLISAKFFYIQLFEKNELEVLKNNGINYLKILSLISFLTFFLGLLIIIFFYTFSSNLKSQYLIFKNKFTDKNEYLAVVNENGLWIKEEINEVTNIIHAKKFLNNELRDITITKSDTNFNPINNIFAKKANIQSKLWILTDVKILNKDKNLEYIDKLIYESSFTSKIISELFSNLSTLNIYELMKLNKNYNTIGYSNTEINIHLNKLFSLPLFCILMTIIGFMIMTKFSFIKSKFLTIISGIFISVIIYYINYLSSVFGTNETLPVVMSIWLPHLILFLVCINGLLKINEIK